MIVARLLIDGHGAVDVSQLAEQLLAWEGRMAETGSLDLLGPSTRQALTAYGLGAPITTTGRHGTTNGAAMRIAPVGVAAEAAPLASLVDRVVEVDRLTHDTGLAHAGAAAVATVVSLGIDGVPFAAAVASAIEAADLAQEQGHYAAGPAVSERINWAIEVVGRARRTAGIDAAMDLVDRVVGTSLATQESVPAAFAVAALAGDDPWEACRWASGVGGDCDTIAAMVGAMLGSSLGARAFSTRAKDRLNEANSLDIEAVAAGLLDVRDKRAGRG
jgi:ADP-ribosylglycohydrolase